MIDVGIVGVGTYLPEKTMKAAEIARLTNGVWSEDAVINKLGIKQRYLPGPDDGTQEMGAKAALKCLENTGVDPKEIDVILCIGEEWKEYPLTTSACYIQDRIGATNAWGIDVQNRCCEELGGVAKGTGEGALGYKLEATTYDDQGDGAQGKNYIQKLVEDDGVFALVGNLGTWNIVAAQDYIEESGVPSVYWGTGSSYQYFNPAQGNEKYTFPVQPIYNTEGRIMYLRAMQLASLEGSGVTSVSKIGVIHSSSDDGASIKAGIEEQRNINIQTNPDQPEVIFAQINSTTATELASQVQLVKDCDVVIIAGNQTYFQAAYTAMQTANVRKPVITSYVNIAPATVPNEATSAEASDIYGGAWVIIDDSADERQKADLLRFIAICDWGVEKGIISRSTADSYLISAYAMSSFIALDVFMTGIDRLADKEITREAFLEAMESAPINVPISGGVNYANGQRIGLDGMSFVKYVRPTEAGAAASTGTFVNVVGMQSIDQILGELDDAE